MYLIVYWTNRLSRMREDIRSSLRATTLVFTVSVRLQSFNELCDEADQEGQTAGRHVVWSDRV